MIRYISKESAASLADCSARTLDDMAKRGLGPPRYRVGGRVKFREDEVLAWIAQQRIEAGAA